MIQAAQARLSGGYGFLRRLLLASRFWLRAARVAISFALKASRAGCWPRPSRACKSWMVMTAALADGDELEEAVGGGDLAVFELEALGLEHAEELLDQPAPLVPLDNAPGVLRARHRVGGQQPPMQRLGAGRRIALAHVDDGH